MRRRFPTQQNEMTNSAINIYQFWWAFEFECDSFFVLFLSLESKEVVMKRKLNPAKKENELNHIEDL